MKAMTSRYWVFALNLLIIWPLAGWLIAEEIGDHPEIAASGTDGSSLEISSESEDEPAAMDSQEDPATELDESTEKEPAVLPTRPDSDSDEVPGEETPAEENGDDSPDRVITPVPAEENEEPDAARSRNPQTRLMPAQPKTRIEAMAFPRCGRVFRPRKN